MTRRGGGGGGPALLFFRGLGEGRLLRGVSEQTGNELVGQLSESQVNLGFQFGEGGGVAGKLLGPGLLLGGEVLLDLGEGLNGVRDSGAGFGIKTQAQGKSFRGRLLLLG